MDAPVYRSGSQKNSLGQIVARLSFARLSFARRSVAYRIVSFLSLISEQCSFSHLFSLISFLSSRSSAPSLISFLSSLFSKKMNYPLTHPRTRLAEAMSLIYRSGLTTTSGGNLSMRSENGDIWITPGAVDKGKLTPKDIVRVRPDGTQEGLHPASSELPFHQAIYRARPDLKAVVHAHPPALVAFSIVRKAPDTAVIPQASQLCGPVGYAPYELPGSEALGKSIANEFATGFNAVIMENHGTVVGGSSWDEAFQRFETLEFCARAILKAHQIGQPRRLTPEQVNRFEHRDNLLPEFESGPPTDAECARREEVVQFIHRACRQGLMISSYGTISVRVDEQSFLINPTGFDRRRVALRDLVLIRNGQREAGKLPSRAVRLHQTIFQQHPEVHCIISTQSPSVTAFCVANEQMDTRTIPESYILLEEIPLLPYGSQFEGGKRVADALAKHTPILLLKNDSVLVTGKSVLETFDRLEVAEFSAASLIDSHAIGRLVPIQEQELQDLKDKFLKD